jgi:hypothetical protein
MMALSAVQTPQAHPPLAMLNFELLADFAR